MQECALAGLLCLRPRLFFHWSFMVSSFSTALLAASGFPLEWVGVCSDDMLSLRNFMDLFWHFDRVHKQFEVPRGVKSKNLWRTESNKSCHNFLSRDAIFEEEWNVCEKTKIVTRFPKSSRDFKKDLEHELGFKANRGAIFSTVTRFWLQKIFPI